MKNVFLTLILFSGIMISSCSKDDNEEQNSLVGTWDLQSFIEDGVSKNINDCEKNSYTIFNENNTYETFASRLITEGAGIGTCSSGVDSGIYVIVDNVLILSSDNSQSNELIPFIIEQRMLTLVFDNFDNNGVIRDGTRLIRR